MTHDWKIAAATAVLALTIGAVAARGATAIHPIQGPATAASTQADPTLKEPYLLYAGDPSRMQVLWQLSTTAISTFAWGTDTTCALGSVQNAEYGSDHQHTATVGDLIPGTRYHYRVTTQGAVHRGSFTAAPLPGTTRTKFLAYGDTRSVPATHDQVAAAMMATCAADPAYQTMTLMAGDFVYYGNNEAYWTNEFFTPAYRNIRGMMAALSYQACLGNHDSDSPVLYTKYFPYPFAGGRYYSFDYGPAHVTVIDQYTPYWLGTDQLQWIADDLAATDRTWKLVLLHEPGWSAGGHPNNTTVQNVLQPLFEQYGVAVVFCGHNHYYARAVVNGVQHVTTGGGGAPADVPSLGYPYVVAMSGASHYCKVAIDGLALTCVAVTPSGAVLDSFVLDKSGPDAVAPTVAITAPVGGERWRAGIAYTIAWKAHDNVGVETVDLDYSVTGVGGPWTPIAHGVPNTGALRWTTPATLTDDARVRVVARDFVGNATGAMGDGPFSIIAHELGVEGALPGGPSLDRPSPNPVHGEARFAFALPGAGAFRVEVLDTAGRLLWHTAGTGLAGAHTVHWDGRATNGRSAGAGLYFVRLITPWGIRGRRLIVLR